MKISKAIEFLQKTLKEEGDIFLSAYEVDKPFLSEANMFVITAHEDAGYIWHCGKDCVNPHTHFKTVQVL